ncbi:MAG TPA: MATE family efflux transporter [Anaeromyxobacteraceae bacterium]|nr:MATE family efflux transporter [Anaeromyxobacteraceae bacterium]
MTEPRKKRIAEELSALGRLALPLALANAAQSFMGLVDTAILGRAGAAPLAGTGLGNLIFWAIGILGVGLMMGLDPLISQAVGAGDRARARSLLWQGAWLACAAAAALAVPMALTPVALVPLGIPPEVARQATGYLLLRMPSLPFLLFFYAGRSYLQAHGAARAVLATAVAANLVHVPVDLLLVFGGASLPAWAGPLRLVPAMGAAGSGLATSLSFALQAGILGLAIRWVGADQPARGLRRLAPAELRRAARVGLPVGLHMAAEVGVFALVGFLAGRLGREPLAAHQIAIAVASFSFNAAVGIGNAGSVRVGWAVGARDTPAARRAGLTAFGAGAGFMSLWGLCFLLFPSHLARLMTDQPEVVAAAAPLMVVAGVFQISDGVQGIGAGVLRGAGDTRFTFLANMVGHWAVGLPVALGLGVGLGLGVTGLWWGLCAGLTAVAAGLFTRFLRLSSREIVPLAERAR